MASGLGLGGGGWRVAGRRVCVCGQAVQSAPLSAARAGARAAAILPPSRAAMAEVSPGGEPPPGHAAQPSSLRHAQLPRPSPARPTPRPGTLDVRIVALDWTLEPPLPGLDVAASPLDGARLGRVPVVRLFGRTRAGQGACVHVHRVSLSRRAGGPGREWWVAAHSRAHITARPGPSNPPPNEPTRQAFPYFYIPCAAPPPGGEVDERAAALAVARALDAALGAARGAGGAAAGQPPQQPPSGPRRRTVDVTLVRGRDFYGYHADEALFWRIALADPGDVRRSADAARAGALPGGPCQPYEAHLPFLLQFKVDHGLAGMAWARVASGAARPPLVAAPPARGWWALDTAEGEAGGGKGAGGGGDGPGPGPSPPTQPSTQDPVAWTAATTPPAWRWDPARAPPRRTVCALEVDCAADALANRGDLRRVPIEVAATAQDGSPMVKSLAAMWDEERGPREGGPWHLRKCRGGCRRGRGRRRGSGRLRGGGHRHTDDGRRGGQALQGVAARHAAVMVVMDVAPWRFVATRRLRGYRREYRRKTATATGSGLP